MIRLGPPLSPQEALAARIGGTIAGPSTIVVGSRLVTVSPLGVVRADGVRIGRWSEPTAVLAARYAATGAVAHV
jgi:hypothetical protein